MSPQMHPATKVIVVSIMNKQIPVKKRRQRTIQWQITIKGEKR